ncbi:MULTISPECIES: hypothetical protein [unclassified Oceanispirochaeta]|uniref:hypothetical protein n=1 Tax=unclassified Oceanispirochaeta TaxID=2635722 RepID=UPI000E08D170|nr:MULTISPECIES: hypothetical protein [unclassified Oceanispirochaeta]MBF9015649.1 hypothetical protein [Oceanispirochaeta sp. M2]NPD73423.1 hypothetical protein [Oceanispirochaeta sp. M1]RDG30896.1 hypothetical protein DV872_15075 [Oceanispirochaeta sp. M1]
MDKVLPIIDELKKIVTSLGDVYLNMADNYPDLFRALDAKLNNLNTDGNNNLDYLVQDIDSSVHKQTVFLERLSESDSVFLDMMTEELEEIKRLDSYIDQIEDDSAELELISLNAMVTALKAGKNGGAFPYITEELQKVSKSSARLSMNLKTKGNDLSKIFSSFINSINDDKSQISELIKSIASEFTSLTGMTRDFQSKSDKVLGDVRNQVGSIKAPLYQIISEVQKHDIIRQSVDHVILALEHIKDSPEKELEKQLDALSYGSRVFGFCYEILNEIHGELEGNYNTFKVKSESLNTLINFIQESGDSIKGGRSYVSYDVQIEEIQRKIETSLNHLKKGSIQANMQKNLDGIYHDIASLEESYSGFSRIINWVKTINISSRVEAAKLPHLENMSYIIENITSRTDSIEESVDLVIKSITEFKKNSDVLIKDFFAQSNKDAVQVDNFGTDLKKSLDEVNDYSLNIKEKMSELIDTGDQFLEFYKMANSDLDRMDKLVGEIKSIINIIEIEKEEFERRLKLLLESEGLDSWELRGDEIRQLIDKFTIYIHKKKVDSEGSLDMDGEGASSGEITLF